MKFLITGASGFVGLNIKKYLEHQGHTVFAPSSKRVNLLDIETLYDWEPKNITNTDAVVHCAGCGGRRNTNDTIDIVYKNIAMAHTAYHAAQYLNPYAKFFFIGSGAENNRSQNISNMIYPNTIPTDYYGLSKSAISEYFSGKKGVCNLRAFGVFGENEETQRFISSAINSYRHKMPIIVHKDRRMDFFYAEDIGRIVEAVCDKYPNEKMHDINLSYEDRVLWLSDIAKYINTLDDHEVDIIVESKSMLDKDYFGNPVMLKELKKNCPELELIGLKEGLRRTYETF